MFYDAFKKEIMGNLPLNKKRQEVITAAFSGGADSVVLLHLLWRLQKETPFSVKAVHIEHGIRGHSSLKDARFAKKFCEKLEIPCEVVHIDVLGYVEKNVGISVEEAARILRYSSLKDQAAKSGSRFICFGHHQDDQVETILLNIIRGSGIAGLCGIPHLRREEKFVYFRPLLNFPKEGILDYCKNHGLEYVEDETNFEVDYTRNRIRLELIPMLETYNPAVKNALLRLSEAALETENFLDEQLSGYETRFTTKDKYIAINLKDYSKMPRILKKHLLREVIKTFSGDFPDYATTEVLKEMAAQDKGSSHREIPGKVVVSREYQMLYFAKDLESLPKPRFLFSKDKKGLYSNRDWGVLVEPIARGDADLDQSKAYSEVFDAEKLLWPLEIRTRKAGDVFFPLGAEGQKKLKDFFIDLKIPKRVRGRIPLLVDAKGRIIWVAGFRISDLVKVDEKTEKYVRLQVLESCHAGSPML